MEWKGWYAYRRGLATNLKEQVVEVTTIQCILRHEDVSTTQRSYIKTAPCSGAGGDAYFGGKNRLYRTCTVAQWQEPAKLLKILEPTNGLEPLTC
jgi:hypothetical protein